MTDNANSPLPCSLCGDAIHGTPVTVAEGLHYCDDVCADCADALLTADRREVTDEEAAEMADEYERDYMTDAEADADVLRGAGMGTDEDYGYQGDGLD